MSVSSETNLPRTAPAPSRFLTTKYTLASPPTGEHFAFATSARGGDGLFRFVWTLAPGKRGPGPHFHETETETFAIVSGTIRITIDGVAKDYAPGDVVVVEPGVVHSFLNPAKEPVVINVSLDGTRMEDAFVPVAVASLGREPRLADILTMMCALVDPYPSTPAIPLHRALIPMLVGALKLFGFRRLTPVEGWDAAG